jgi:hypothetical protein
LIDLFTCGDGKLLPVLPKIIEGFGGKLENARWAFHPRGAKGFDDVSKHVLSRQHVGKTLVNSTESKFGKIDIWKISEIEEMTFLSHKSEGSSISTMMFLDGLLQTSTADEKLFHEALVHPAMVAHEHGTVLSLCCFYW